MPSSAAAPRDHPGRRAAGRRRGGWPSPTGAGARCPSGTVGGRIACAKTPPSSARSQSAIARRASPTMTGTIWVRDGRRRRARAPPSASRRTAAFRRSCSTMPGWPSSSASAAIAAPTEGGGSAGGEDERPGDVDQQVDDLRARADVGAVAAERLAQRADDDVDLAGRARRRDRAAPAGADRAGAVRLVDHQPAAVAPGELEQSSASGATSPSIEKTPSVTISAARAARLAQPPGEMLECRGGGRRSVSALEIRQPSMMLAWLSSSEKTTSPAPASAATVPGVGQVARAEQQRRLGSPSKSARRCSSRSVQRHRARDQPRCAGAGAVALGGLGGRLADARVVGEPEVVVRAQQQHLGAVERDPRALRALDQAQAPVEPGRAQVVEAVGDVVHERAQSPQPAGAAVPGGRLG